MSERGVFAVDRGVWDHPILQSREPYSRREAWLWLVSEATWKAKTIYVDGKRVSLNRGQLAHSIRFIADRWRWPKSNVARFLDMLKTDTMIETQAGHGITVITICKYDEYQRVSLPDRDKSGTESGTRVGHERDKEEDKEDREKNGAPPLLGDQEDEKAELFRRARKFLGKDAGWIVTNLLRSIGSEDDPKVIRKARARIEEASTKAEPIPWLKKVMAPKQGDFRTLSGMEGII